ncbi:MAG: DUF4423 domain-containing protein [Bacteriovoracaceae bacterium]|nr:DUF4423 domain-containing protein [Bacteriovoracaceae bacterium]
MNKQFNIYSLSPQLIEINQELKPLIKIGNIQDLASEAQQLGGFCVLFQWQNLNEVLKLKHSLGEKNIFGIRFICINSDLMPEERLKLLNSNIEFLTIEKFKSINAYFFNLSSNIKKSKILFIDDDESQFENIKNILNKAIESLESTPIEKRDQSSMMVTTSPEKMSKAKEMIKDFRRHLTSFLEDTDDKSAVYQLSVSLFPLLEIKNRYKKTKEQ